MNWEEDSMDTLEEMHAQGETEQERHKKEKESIQALQRGIWLTGAALLMIVWFILWSHR